eukprot:m.146242 g.146242  ORF g.146242 m.146242 type:complete len:757 (+) comp17764_c0_seq1:65-2335(+)
MSSRKQVEVCYDNRATTSAPPRTLYDKIFSEHVVHQEDNGTALIYIDRHLVHEVTSPQAFEGLRNATRQVRRNDCTLTTVDHNVPTSSREGHDMTNMAGNGFITEQDSLNQVLTLEAHVKEFGLTYYGMDDSRQGIVHVIGPEQGFTLPGTTVVCGDSHTATHGAFGALAFGIGTSEVEHVLATQTLMQKKAKNMRIVVNGTLPAMCKSKDLILHIIGVIGTAGGTGFVIEFAGTAIEALSMEARMSMCNMAIEAGAKAGLIAPDDITLEYVRGRPLAPKGATWEAAAAYWRTLKTDPGASFDTEVVIDSADIVPTVTWGTSPQDVARIDGAVPDPAREPDAKRRAAMERALTYMGLEPNTPLTSIKVDKVFIGSCTNSRIEDLRAAAQVAYGKKVASNIKTAMIVPGSGLVRQQAEAEGLDRIFKDAGFDWREAGCSMCLGMNPDQLSPEERCASTSNRNFEGRQGARGRTHLMSPSMAAAAAIAGHLVDVRDLTTDLVDLQITTGKRVTDSKDYATRSTKVQTVTQSTTTDNPTTATGGASTTGGGGIPPFITLSGVAAPLDMENVDTDKIIPKQFLKTIRRSGLGAGAFYEIRHREDGLQDPEFVLNQSPYDTACMLITGDNFGCGSSREHAPWALLDLGIRCVISTTIADIFKNNCFKNGMLPIELPKEHVAVLMEDAKNKHTLTVDLPSQTISRESGDKISFEVDAFRKECLIQGLDDIDLTLQKVEQITLFEKSRSIKTPWLDGAGYVGH